jgi:hypothetical protein
MAHETSTTISTKRSPMSPADLRARWHDAQQRIASAASVRAHAEQTLTLLREWAREDGLVKVLSELESPPPAPAGEAMVRVRALKAYKAFHRMPWGESMECSGAAGSVNDLPRALLKKLADRVVEVAADTPVRAVPLKLGDATDD